MQITPLSNLSYLHSTQQLLTFNYFLLLNMCFFFHIRAHHGFGWVGEWANTGLVSNFFQFEQWECKTRILKYAPFVLCRSDVNCKPTGQMDLTRIETLHHADRDKTETLILDLVVWLQHLISQSRTANGERSPIKSPVRSPTQRGSALSLYSNKASSSSSPLLTPEDQEMLRDVKYRKFVPGISKSQEFDTKARHNKQSKLIKSNSHSQSSGNRKEFLSIRSLLPVIDFQIDKTKALDTIDNLKVK